MNEEMAEPVYRAVSTYCLPQLLSMVVYWKRPRSGLIHDRFNIPPKAFPSLCTSIPSLFSPSAEGQFHIL
eukprot:1149555-Pelagomonas_calceolata.AAC.7